MWTFVLDLTKQSFLVTATQKVRRFQLNRFFCSNFFRLNVPVCSPECPSTSRNCGNRRVGGKTQDIIRWLPTHLDPKKSWTHTHLGVGWGHLSLVVFRCGQIKNEFNLTPFGPKIKIALKTSSDQGSWRKIVRSVKGFCVVMNESDLGNLDTRESFINSWAKLRKFVSYSSVSDTLSDSCLSSKPIIKLLETVWWMPKSGESVNVQAEWNEAFAGFCFQWVIPFLDNHVRGI